MLITTTEKRGQMRIQTGPANVRQRVWRWIQLREMGGFNPFFSPSRKVDRMMREALARARFGRIHR